jgi:hypothetical protein
MYLGYCTVWLWPMMQIFQMHILPLSSGLKCWRQSYMCYSITTVQILSERAVFYWNRNNTRRNVIARRPALQETWESQCKLSPLQTEVCCFTGRRVSVSKSRYDWPSPWFETHGDGRRMGSLYTVPWKGENQYVTTFTFLRARTVRAFLVLDPYVGLSVTCREFWYNTSFLCNYRKKTCSEISVSWPYTVLLNAVKPSTTVQKVQRNIAHSFTCTYSSLEVSRIKYARIS